MATKRYILQHIQLIILILKRDLKASTHAHYLKGYNY